MGANETRKLDKDGRKLKIGSTVALRKPGRERFTRIAKIIELKKDTVVLKEMMKTQDPWTRRETYVILWKSEFEARYSDVKRVRYGEI